MFTILAALTVALSFGRTLSHPAPYSDNTLWTCSHQAVSGANIPVSSSSVSSYRSSTTASSSTAQTSSSAVWTSSTTVLTSSSTASTSSSTAWASSSNVPTSGDNTAASIWKPAAGITWNYDLSDVLTSTSTSGIAAWDIDLFANSASVISGLKANGAKVICYFSAGSYENWRPDAKEFLPSDLGKPLDGWPGENWLNIRSSNVHNIMGQRLDLAKSKGCDGVDPDNVDGYDNDNGLGLTTDDSISYMQFLAKAASARGLAIGLKNAGEIIPEVIDIMQWSVNEQCVEYQECDTYAPFLQHGKPVFHVEYPKGNADNNNAVSASTRQKYCNDPREKGFSNILKNLNLDSWIDQC